MILKPSGLSVSGAVQAASPNKLSLGIFPFALVVSSTLSCLSLTKRPAADTDPSSLRLSGCTVHWPTICFSFPQWRQWLRQIQPLRDLRPHSFSAPRRHLLPGSLCFLSNPTLLFCVAAPELRRRKEKKITCCEGLVHPALVSRTSRTDGAQRLTCSNCWPADSKKLLELLELLSAWTAGGWRCEVDSSSL